MQAINKYSYNPCCREIGAICAAAREADHEHRANADETA